MAGHNQPRQATALPNRFGRFFLLSLEEILGRSGMNAVLNQAGLTKLIDELPPDDTSRRVSSDLFSQVSEALEGVYGVRGGRGIALRAGRASFKLNLRTYGTAMGMEAVDFRLLPLNQKIRQGLQALARLYNEQNFQEVELSEDDEFIYWKSPGCPLCFERRSRDVVCHYTVGLLQEALYWLSAGKYYHVDEVECAACGDLGDLIRVDKNALD